MGEVNQQEQPTNADGSVDTMYADTAKVVSGMSEQEALDEEHGTGEEAGETGDEGEVPGDAEDGTSGESTDNAEDGGDTGDGTSGYMQSDNAVFNDVVSVLDGAGVTPDEAEAIFTDALQARDASKINMETLSEKVGGELARMIVGNVTAEFERIQSVTDKAFSTVYDIAGGEDNWKAATEWGKKNLTDAERAEFNVMFAAGGTQLKLGAKEVMARFKASSEYTEEANLLKGDNETVDLSPLSRAEYFRLVEEEHRRVGGPRPAVVNQLRERRARGR